MASGHGAAGGDAATGDAIAASTISDASHDASLGAVQALCASTPARPLTAGSYTEPDTGLTMHWPDGWALAAPASTPDSPILATLTTPITVVFNGSPTASQARFDVRIAGYGNASQMANAVPNRIMWATQGGGTASATTLVGHPAAVWWALVPPTQPLCPTPCGVSDGLATLEVGGLVQFAMVDGGWPNGVEVDLVGSAPEAAEPASVFCDMEAMILGVTVGP